VRSLRVRRTVTSVCRDWGLFESFGVVQRRVWEEHKAVSKGSEEKKYIKTLKCFTHTHELYLNHFSFKVHEKSTVEYQPLVAQARKYRIRKVSYAESQQLLE
jgi:hypothetical protein